MKRLTLDRVLNWVGVTISIGLFSLVIFNIMVHGITGTASFEF
jgi:hypothetical protein